MSYKSGMIAVFAIALLFGIVALLIISHQQPTHIIDDNGNTWEIVEDFSDTKEGWNYINGTWVLWSGGYELSFPVPTPTNGTLYLLDFSERERLNSSSKEIKTVLFSLLANDNRSIPCVKRVEIGEQPKIITLYCVSANKS